jgi:hypothetical protein
VGGGAAVGEGLGVRVATGVVVGAFVTVGAGVFVSTAGGVEVGVPVGASRMTGVTRVAVGVTVEVGVAVGGTGVGVSVDVAVAVGVAVAGRNASNTLGFLRTSQNPPAVKAAANMTSAPTATRLQANRNACFESIPNCSPFPSLRPIIA